MMSSETHNVAQTMRDAVEGYVAPALIDLSDLLGNEQAAAVVLPDRKRIVSVEDILAKVRGRPRHHAGTYHVDTVDDLIAVTKRFAVSGATTTYARVLQTGSGTVESVFDHNSPLTPGGTDHRAVLDLEESPAFKAWREAAHKWMRQREFAAFLESRMLDLIAVPEGHALHTVAAQLFVQLAPPPAVFQVSKGLSLTVEQEVSETVVLETGETQFTFVEAHKNKVSGVQVPRLFAIGVPLWPNGVIYSIACRLRYRVENKTLVWQVEPLHVDRVIEHATTELLARLRADLDGVSVVVRGALDE